MVGSGQLTMWGESIWIILTLVVVGVVLTATLILGWTFLRIWLRRGAIERAQTEKRAARLGPDGLPYPPSDEGVCDRCDKAFQSVYYLDTGQRLCESCYRTVKELDDPLEHQARG